MTLPFLRCAAYPMSFPAASVPFTRLAVASSYSTTSPTRPPPTSASNAGTWQANQELAKSGSAAGLKPRTRPTGLRSPAEVRASQQAQELREAAISNSGWRKSQEEGEEEERVVYSRRGSPPNGLVWAFIISTTTCLVVTFDTLLENSILFPSANKQRFQQLSPSSSSDTSLLSDEATTLPPLTNQLPVSRSPYERPTKTLAVLAAATLIVPAVVFGLWAPNAIVRVYSYRPSRRVRLISRLDTLFRFVNRSAIAGDPIGTKVDFVAASQPKVNGKLVPQLILRIPSAKTSAGRRKILDLSEPSPGELGSGKLVVDRDLLRQAFTGIEEVVRKDGDRIV